MLDLTCTLQHQGAGRDGIAQWDTVRVFACRGAGVGQWGCSGYIYMSCYTDAFFWEGD